MGGSLAYERWEGSAKLTGYGAVVAQEYPITVWQQCDEVGERVDLEISQPMESPGQIDASQYKIINIRVKADEARAEELAMEAVLEQADGIAFA
jgi:hypothetical protein